MKSATKTAPIPKNFVDKEANTAKSEMILRMQKQTKIYLLSGLIFLGIVAALLAEPVSQNQIYHSLADTRTLFSIPNFWNVISNLPFLVVGLWGMSSFFRSNPEGAFLKLKPAYLVFYLGIFLTGFGSAYYHLEPNNATLLWDRLPMTIAFMTFFAIIIGEFISLKTAQKLVLPLLFIGAASVLYWYLTESAGRGDLRFYALVQFLPILLIPLIMLLFNAKTNTNLYTWLVIAAYLIAKIFETYDDQIFEFTNQISGHTLKHLAAALAPLLFLNGLFKRKITEGLEA